MATEKVRNLGLINIGPLKAKVMTVSMTGAAFEGTKPLVKEQRLVEAFGAISRMMKWKYSNNEALTQH